MSKLLLTRGLPGSGKSTFARKWVSEDPNRRLRVNRDDTRIFLGLKHGENEPLVTRVQQAAVKDALWYDMDVIVDDTNLNAKFAKEWLKIAVDYGVEVVWHDSFLAVPLATVLQRDADREASVGSKVIMDFYQRYLSGGRTPKRPQLDANEVPVHARYEGTPGKPKAFLVDLDGTIASNGPVDRSAPTRGYFDWHKVRGDEPIKVIIDIVHMFEAQGLIAVYVSGRDAVCYGGTDLWITDQVYSGDNSRQFPLHMRPEGDMRKDSIVKLEIFDKHIRDNYDVQFALDDRNAVVEAYRGIGLTVLQVADGNF